jgi:hypothetical protein
MARGDRREPIMQDDEDHRAFLAHTRESVCWRRRSEPEAARGCRDEHLIAFAHVSEFKQSA